MAKFNLNRTVFDKESYVKTIDTSFSELQLPALPIEDTINVEEFFNLYNTIFYDIPIDGDINSHEYIVRTSGDYIGENSSNEEIQILLDEITSLREQLLTTQQELADLQTSTSVNTPQ
jgi:hypothetical protein